MKKALVIIALLATQTPPASAESEALGRLFLTPQQRAELDRLRLQDPRGGQKSSLTINGEVRSSSGGRTRWINGQADWENRAAAPALAVGDSFDPITGERRSLVGDGRIRAVPRQAGQ